MTRKNKNGIKVLVSENSGSLGIFMINFLNKKEDIRLMGGVNNANEALELCQEQMPDVMILDLLTLGEDGLFILKRLSQDFITRPKVIVLTKAGEEMTVGRAFELGAKDCMVRPINLDELYKKILECMDVDSDDFQEEAPLAQDVNEEIAFSLLAAGIPDHIQGYNYLCDAIKMVLDAEDVVNHITTRIYPEVAERYQTSPSSVERAIWYAIKIGWTRGQLKNNQEFLGLTSYCKLNKPTNGEFIALLADQLKMQHKA